MANAVAAAAVALIACAVFALLTGRVGRKTFDGLTAIAYLLLLAYAAHQGSYDWALVDAALCAYFAWRWWTGGGGDDTRRRLRKAAKRFEPRRRTAGAHA